MQSFFKGAPIGNFDVPANSSVSAFWDFTNNPSLLANSITDSLVLSCPLKRNVSVSEVCRKIRIS